MFFTGLCFILNGVLILMAQSIHLPEDAKYKYSGILAVFMGIIFVLFRPDMSLTL